MDTSICGCGDSQNITLAMGDNVISGEFRVVSYQLSLISSERIDVTDKDGNGCHREYISTPLRGVRLNLEAFSEDVFISDMLTVPKIRNKKVDDCTIQELLYAVRQKVKVVK